MKSWKSAQVTLAISLLVAVLNSGCAMIALLLAAGCSRNGSVPSMPSISACRTPALARTPLPPDQNALHLWTNAMARLKVHAVPRELHHAFADVCMFKTNTALAEVSGALVEWRNANQEAFVLMEKA